MNAKSKESKVEIPDKVCVLCGGSFKKTKNDTLVSFGKRKYCSLVCARKARSVKHDRTCVKCGKIFMCRPADVQRFCSKKCGRTGQVANDSAMSYEEIGTRLGISVDQVKWIEAKALIKLRKAAESNPNIMEFFSGN